MDEKKNTIPANFYDLSKEDLQSFLVEHGEPKFRLDQIWEGVYKHFWDGPASFHNIPVKTRNLLSENFSFTNLEPVKSQFSSDRQTEKALFRIGQNYIETVLMGYRERQTLCISSQSGCPIGCIFCSTGQMGFKKNLTRGEIVEQVLFFSRKLKLSSLRLTNVVIMGMGEPFLNYESTLQAIDVLNDPAGFGMSERRFTISTVGIISGIKRFTREKRQVNLAVSLHAPNDSLRSSLIPINKKYPLHDLLDACREYVEFTNRRISFEYALIDGVNDSEILAKELANLLKGLLCHVNLIQLNSSPGYSMKSANIEKTKSFIRILENAGIPATLRLRRGLDIKAGCGQLAYSSAMSL